MRIGTGCGIGVATSRGQTASPFPSNGEIARALVSPTTRRPLILQGSSRCATPGMDVSLMTSATNVAWSGTSLLGTAASTVGHRTTSVTKTGGDVTATTSPEIGGTLNWFPTHCIEVVGLAPDEVGTTIHACRISDATLTADAYPLLFARLGSSTVSARSIWWNHAAGLNCTTEPGYRFYIAEFTNNWTVGGSCAAPYTKVTTGAGYGYCDTVSQAAGYSWGADTKINWAMDPLIHAVNTGGILAFEPPFIQVDLPGVVLHNWSASGSTLARWVNTDIIADSCYSGLMPLYGDDPILMLEAYPETLNAAQTLTAMGAAIARFRNTAGEYAPVIVHTGYPHSTSGASPAWLGYVREAAASIGGVLVIDTYSALPDYATGVGLGYYSDTVHYSDTGRAAFCAAIDSLLVAAAA